MMSADNPARIEGPLRSTLLGSAVGLAVAMAALEPRFVAGSGGMWTSPQNDIGMYLVAWNYYLADTWRLPLFSVPALGYPEGGSVLFNDALPVAALLTKIVYSVVGARVNPFGWWILLTYVLQGGMAARLVHAAGARSPWAAVAAAGLAVCSWPFLWRLQLGHLALSGHFVILWALALYFESLRRAQLKTLELFAVAALTLLVNAYLFAMVGLIACTAALALWTRSQLPARVLGQAALGAACLFAIAIAAGYGVMLTNPTQLRGSGFAEFSWNLTGLLVPPDGVLGLLAGIPRDATSGQFEGEAYIGHGALLLVGIGSIASPREALRAVRRHGWLCALFVLLATYAASSRVYFGQTLVIAWDLPPLVSDLSNYFRASGRFIWPLAYGLMVLPLALVFRSWQRPFAIGIAVVAVGLQLMHARPALESARAMTSSISPALLDPGIVRWIGEHERIWVYPSWGCGSLGGPERPWFGREWNRDMQIQLAASEAGVPINSVYTSRQLKDCRAEAAWGRRPVFERGVLYFLGHAAVRDSAPLTRLVRSRSDACVPFQWAIGCSTTSPVPAGAGTSSPSLRPRRGERATRRAAGPAAPGSPPQQPRRVER